MAEEREHTQIETPEETASSLPIMPAAGHLALAMGLQGAADNPDLAQRTGDLLAKQSAMLDVQMEDLHEQRVLQISHLRLRRWGEWLSLILRGLSVAGGIAVAFALAVVVWQARNASGIIIAPFSVPPDLAATGLTGDVVANRMLDRLAELQEQTDSARAPETFRNAGEDEIRVEIPETGVSLGELLKLLHGWLGHETHISGDVVRMGTGLTVTSRVGETPGRGFTGDPANLDDLIKQAAETVYAKTQPYRYGVYLSRNGRNAEALEVMKALALSGPERERAWGYIGWGVINSEIAKSPGILRAGLALNPNLAVGWTGLAAQESYIGHDEAALAALHKADYLLNKTRNFGGVSNAALGQTRMRTRALTAEATGDYSGAAAVWSEAATAVNYNSSSTEAGVRQAIDTAYNYDLALLNETGRWDALGQSVNGPLLRAKREIAKAIVTNSWQDTAQELERIELDAKTLSGDYFIPLRWAVEVHPWRAVALAQNGKIEEARTLIGATPADCYNCLRARGMIEEAAGNNAAADTWFARAIAIGPSLPFAVADAARLSLKTGDVARATKLATLASQLGPKWPDPLLILGKISLLRKDCQQARSEFSSALKLAPRWLEPHRLIASCSAPN